MTKVNVLLVLISLFGFKTLVAQTPACTYTDCALKMRAGGFAGSPRLVAGTREQLVASLRGTLNADVLSKLGESDSARHSAALYNRYTVSSTRFRLASLGALAVGVYGLSKEKAELSLGGLIGGAMLGFVSNSAQRKAYDSLNDAIWWYNSTLSR